MRPANKIRFFIPIACVLCALLFACENPWMAEILQEKTITFESNGGSSVPSQKLYAGERVKRPSNPVWQGYVFEDWYTDNWSFGEPYDFNFVPINDMTLYARWREGTGSETTIVIDSVKVMVSNPSTGYPQTKEANPATGESGYTCGDVTWTPTAVDNFESETTYYAEVTLTADNGYKFTPNTTAYINGHEAKLIYTNDKKVTVSHTFNPTGKAKIIGIAIITQPKMTYTHGDKLNLSGLTVTLTYEGGNFETVQYNETSFDIYGIGLNLSDGTILSCLDHHNTSIEVIISDTVTAETQEKLKINKADLKADYFDIGETTFIYDGKPKPVEVKAKQEYVGIGIINVFYTPTNGNRTPTAPSDIGTYDVTLNVYEGANYKAANYLSVGTLTIKEAIFNTVAELKTYLGAISISNIDNPIAIKLNITDTNDFLAIKDALDTNQNVYVTLDLSGSTITTIPDNAFWTTTGNASSATGTLVGVIIPESVTIIGKNAFRGCVNLANVNIPSNVTRIDDDAFHGCTSLANVTIPDKVEYIGREAFGSCPITSIVIPSSVTTIGQWAFDGGNVLTSVEFKGTITSSSNFDVAAFGSDSNDLIARYSEGGPGKYTRQSGSTLWKPEIFTSVDALNSWLEAQPNNTAADTYKIKLNVSKMFLDIYGNPISTLDGSIADIINTYDKYVSIELVGDTLTTIGYSAFYSCECLTGITIPQGVTIINDYVFNYCANLTSIIIPNSVTKIGKSEYVFKDCNSLTSVTFESAGVDISYAEFPHGGSLDEAYTAGGAGTYIRSSGGTVWEKATTTP